MGAKGGAFSRISDTPMYKAWENMRSRCYNRFATGYPPEKVFKPRGVK